MLVGVHHYLSAVTTLPFIYLDQSHIWCIEQQLGSFHRPQLTTPLPTQYRSPSLWRDYALLSWANWLQLKLKFLPSMIKHRWLDSCNSVLIRNCPWQYTQVFSHQMQRIYTKIWTREYELFAYTSVGIIHICCTASKIYLPLQVNNYFFNILIKQEGI